MSKRQRRSVRHRRDRIITRYRDAVSSEPANLEPWMQRVHDTLDADLPDLERSLEEYIAAREQPEVGAGG